MKFLKDNKGFGLAELVAVLPLGILVMVALTVGVIKFSMAYTEITLYSQLQREVINAIESVKYGYPKSPYTDNQNLIGLSTAQKVIIAGAQNSSTQITLKPPNLTSASGDSPYYSKFFLNRQGFLMVTSYYGNSTFTDQVFPKDKTKGNQKSRFKILNNDIFINSTPFIDGSTSNEIGLVTIHIKAQVRFRKRGKNQNAHDDLKKNTKTVDFKATIYAANT